MSVHIPRTPCSSGASNMSWTAREVKVTPPIHPLPKLTSCWKLVYVWRCFQPSSTNKLCCNKPRLQDLMAWMRGTRCQDVDSCTAKQHQPGMQATLKSNLVSNSGGKGFEASQPKNCRKKLPAKWGNTRLIYKNQTSSWKTPMMLCGEQVETLMVQWNNRLPKRSTNQCEHQIDVKVAQAKQDRWQLSDAQLLDMSRHTQPFFSEKICKIT